MRQGTKSLFVVAALLSVLTVGCGDDKKTTIIAGRHLITQVGTKDVGATTVPADGTDAAGDPITITVLGDEFLDRSLEVRLVEDAAGTFEDPAVDPRVEEDRRTGLKFIEVPHTLVNQSELEFTLPASPLLVDATTGERTGRVRVQVLQRNLEADVATTDANVLTYVTSSAASGGLSGSLSLASDDNGAFSTLFPGQGGVHVVARISNFTGEDVQISAVNSESINFSGSDAQLLDFVTRRFATDPLDIPNGEERTVDFYVAATEDLIGTSVAGVASFNAVGANSQQNRGAVASGSLFQVVTPLIRSFGGSVKSLSGGAAGNGGALTLASQAELTLGPPATAVADPITAATGFADNTGVTPPGSTDIPLIDDSGAAVIDEAAGPLTAVGQTFSIQSTGTGDGILIVRVTGDLELEDCVFDLDFANGGEDVVEVRFVVDGSITIVDTTFNFNGLDDSDTTFAAAGLVLIADALNAALEPVILDTVTINSNGGSSISTNGGNGGGLLIDGGALDTTGDGAGAVTLYAVTINAQGGRSSLATSGAGGGLDIDTDDSAVAVAANCTFDLRGGGNLGPNTNAAGAGGVVLIDSADTATGGDVQYEATTNQDGGDLDGTLGSGTGGVGGAFTIDGAVVQVGSPTNSVVMRNGGSNATTGGFGAGNGGNGGAIAITTDTDADDDGAVTLATGSALVGIGGAADGAGDAGNGSAVTINAVSTTPSTLAGHIVTSGGWVHSEAGSTGGSAGLAGNITINIDGDIVVPGKLIARGGSVAAERGEPADHDVSATFGGSIEIDTTFSDGAVAAAPDGALVISGLIDVDGGVGDDASGPGGSMLLIADGEDATPNGLLLAQTGVLSARGGADVGGGGAPGGAIGLEAHSGTANSNTRLIVAGTITADGGATIDADGNAVWGPAGSVSIASTDGANNDGEVTIEETGVITVRGDGTAGNEIEITAGAGSTSPLTIAGRLEVAEATMNQGAVDLRSQLVIIGADGNVVLESTGMLLGNRSTIAVLHDTSAANDVSMLISGLIENDHRDLDDDTGFQSGVIVLNSDAGATGFEITIDDTARLVANAGTVSIVTNLVTANNGGISFAGEIVADAFDNPVIGQGQDGDVGSEDGGNVAIGSFNIDDTALFSSAQGSISANGVNIDDVGYIGLGGDIDIGADAIEIDATGGSSSLALSTNGGVGSGDETTNQVHAGNIDVEALEGDFVIDTTGAITADAGHRGDGGDIDFINDGAVAESYTLTGTGLVSANAGASAAADPNGLALNGGIGGVINLEHNDTGEVVIAKSLSANGGDNAGGPGGFGGVIELDVPNGTGGTVLVEGSFAVNGGSSSYSAGQGGDGGYVVFGNDIGLGNANIDDDLAFDGPTTMSANGGSGPVRGGDAGAIVVNVEEGGTNEVTISTGSSWSVSLAPGTGGAEGVLYVDEDVDAPALPTVSGGNPVVITE